MSENKFYPNFCNSEDNRINICKILNNNLGRYCINEIFEILCNHIRRLISRYLSDRLYQEEAKCSISCYISIISEAL